MAKKLEITQAGETETSELMSEAEILPFQEFESEADKTITEKYANDTKIDPKTVKTVDGFLTRDLEEARQDFALEWFKNNEERVKAEGAIIPPGASDDWKISMALSTKEGGFNCAADLNKPEYKGSRDIMDKIGILRTDMGKSQIPPETPFLLLNYLQTGIEKEKKDIADLKVKAEQGDQLSGVLADNKEKDLGQRYLSMKELAGNVMGEDLKGNAEKKVGGDIPTKEGWVESSIDSAKIVAETKIKKELLDAEWQKFNSLSPEQQRAYGKKSGMEEGQAIDHSGVFTVMLEYCAKKNGIEGENAFYGLLQKGYKPHEAKVKGFWSPKFIILNQKGVPTEMPIGERDAFVKKAEEEYAKKIEEEAKKELEGEWDANYNNRVDEEIKNRVEELAKSPENVEGGIEKVYEKARERIVEEYVKKRLEKDPKTQEQISTIEKEFGKKGKKVNVKEILSNTLAKKGALENLEGEDNVEFGRSYIKKFLRDGWGVRPNEKIIEGISEAEYHKAKKTSIGLLGLILRIIEASLKPSTLKGKTKKKK